MSYVLWLSAHRAMGNKRQSIQRDRKYRTHSAADFQKTAVCTYKPLESGVDNVHVFLCMHAHQSFRERSLLSDLSLFRSVCVCVSYAVACCVRSLACLPACLPMCMYRMIYISTISITYQSDTETRCVFASKQACVLAHRTHRERASQSGSQPTIVRYST